MEIAVYRTGRRGMSARNWIFDGNFVSYNGIQVGVRDSQQNAWLVLVEARREEKDCGK